MSSGTNPDASSSACASSGTSAVASSSACASGGDSKSFGSELLRLALPLLPLHTLHGTLPIAAGVLSAHLNVLDLPSV
jgi:hypothetical protein